MDGMRLIVETLHQSFKLNVIQVKAMDLKCNQTGVSRYTTPLLFKINIFHFDVRM